MNEQELESEVERLGEEVCKFIVEVYILDRMFMDPGDEYGFFRLEDDGVEVAEHLMKKEKYQEYARDIAKRVSDDDTIH